MDKNLKIFNGYAIISFLLCTILVILAYYNFDRQLARWIYLNNIQKVYLFSWIIYIPNVAIFISSVSFLAIFIFNKINTRRHMKKNKLISCIIAITWSSYLSLILVKIFKFIFGRIGPKYWLMKNFDLNGYGFHPFHGYQALYQAFPSGHTTVSFAIISVLCYAYPKCSLPAILVALLIFVSLVLTENHYLADCIAGMFLGIIVGLLTGYFFDLNKFESNNRISM